MYGLIKTTIRVGLFLNMYSIIFAQIAGFIPEIVSAFTLGGLPLSVSMAVLCAVQTLNWLFGSHLVNLAFIFWLALPPVKLGIYFINKAYHM